MIRKQGTLKPLNQPIVSVIFKNPALTYQHLVQSLKSGYAMPISTASYIGGWASRQYVPPSSDSPPSSNELIYPKKIHLKGHYN